MITYTNIVKTKVLDPLRVLLLAEFPNIRVSYEQEVDGGFPNLLVVRPTSDSLIEYQTSSQIRNYVISITYFERFGGSRPKNRLERITETAERVKRLLFNNRTHSATGAPSGTNWYDGRVLAIDYNIDLPEDYSGVELTFQCHHDEVTS